jgi:hypothetical protein
VFENGTTDLALHRLVVVEVLFHDQPRIPVDVDMVWGMVTDVGDEHEATSPDLRHE